MRKTRLAKCGGVLRQKMTGWLVFLSMTASACTMESLPTAAHPNAAQKRDDERPASRSAQTGPRAKEPALSKQTTSQLIDRLADLSETGSAFHSGHPLRSDGFIVLREVDHSSSYALRDDETVPPVIRELVRRGVAALPDLLKHLSDDRSTRIVVGNGGGPYRSSLGMPWFGGWYDSRYRDPARQPPNVNTDSLGQRGRYTVKVGDLCYVIVGQIVNRLSTPASIEFVIYSPIESPGLAAALRQDWSGLTAEQHQQSLMQDAFRKSYSYGPPEATQRLCFFYPKAGETFAVKLLARRLYTERKVEKFVNKQLLQTGNVAKWRQLIDTFQRSEGLAAAAAIPFVLCQIAEKDAEEDAEEDGNEARAKTSKAIIQRLYSHFDCYNPPFVDAAALQDQFCLVRGLQWFQSEKVDESVYQLFQNISQHLQEADPEDRSSDYWLDGMAISCIDRLADKGHNEEFRSFCRRRLKQFTPAERAERTNIRRPAVYQEWLERLGR